MTRIATITAAIGLTAVGCLPHQTPDRAQPPVAMPEQWTGAGEDPGPGCYRLATMDAPGCFGLDGAPAGELDPAARGQAATAPAFAPRPGAWWGTFEDPALTGLIERALDDSQQVRSAWARIAEARAQARRARAAQYPRFDARLSGSYQRQVATFGGEDFFGAMPGEMPGDAPERELPSTIEFQRYSATLDGSYRPDVFGESGAAAGAAELETRAARANLGDIALTLAADVSDAYFGLLEARRRRALLREQLQLSRDWLEIVREQYERGLAPALDLHQQRRQTASILARLAAISGAEQRARSLLATLVGVAPERLRIPPRPDLPEPSEAPQPGVPAKVVLRRPDVVAARRRLQAADQRVAAAAVARLPSFELQGSIGFGGQRPQDTFDDVIWSALGTLTQPIWHGGALAADQDRAQATAQARLADYADTLVRALSDVETALAELRKARASAAALEEMADAARAAAREAELRYLQGLIEFLPLLDAERALQAAQLELLQARGQWLTARVTLQRALGGDWTTELDPPPERD